MNIWYNNMYLRAIVRQKPLKRVFFTIRNAVQAVLPAAPSGQLYHPRYRLSIIMLILYYLMSILCI